MCVFPFHGNHEFRGGGITKDFLVAVVHHRVDVSQLVARNEERGEKERQRQRETDDDSVEQRVRDEESIEFRTLNGE